MKKWIVGAIIAAMVGWAIYDFVVPRQDSAEEQATESGMDDAGEVGLAVGDIAPEIELKTLEGETVRLSDYRGQRVFVNFWATWCPPCRAEMPDMQKLYEEQEVPVEILAVNLTDSENDEEGVSQFVTDFGLSFPILMDVEAETANTYQVRGVPVSYMIDQEGRISFVAPGAMNHDMMIQEVEKME
ncbi:peroxiredoxin family protein [Jeotgalibacillus proteolyticus]|uniref:peroxiredoxin family protein n=1 Tax=Jeotgalibacillus proteolyticus TaxID=2082395 RepID=UPI003CEBC69C